MPETHTTESLPHQRAATPWAFPAPGTFGVTQRVTLLSATPGATIHYTTDGSAPTTASLIFEPYRLPVLEAGNQAGTSSYVLRALAAKPGLEASDVATFTYTIERRAPDHYKAQALRPGLYMLLDYDDTKMYLVVGSERALLVDAGLGTGDLRGLVESLIGPLPLEVVITHAHPDHIARMAQFQGRYPVYLNYADLPLVQRFNAQLHYAIDPAQIIDLHEGDVFNLGDCAFTVYAVPGHSAGSVVLFEPSQGLLLAGDAVGSNRPTIVDSLWMQFPGMAKIDVYLSTLQGFRAKLAGQIKITYGGHNDAAIIGEEYLDNLQQAAQTLVDQGEAVLVPSLRPTDVWQVVVGDRLTDPNWAAINVSKGACLTVPPDEMATLSNLQLRPGALDAGFTPFRFDYTATAGGTDALIEIFATTTSNRCRSFTINGAPWRSSAAYPAQLHAGDNHFVVTVTSPDGSATNTYTLIISRA
jgi:glyoxylase-like metal-dependent hydrolase (beta-lactamase superfamily II)